MIPAKYTNLRVKFFDCGRISIKRPKIDSFRWWCIKENLVVEVQRNILSKRMNQKFWTREFGWIEQHFSK